MLDHVDDGVSLLLNTLKREASDLDALSGLSSRGVDVSLMRDDGTVLSVKVAVHFIVRPSRTKDNHGN